MYRRLWRPRLALPAATAISLAATLLTYAALTFIANMSADRALGISGLTFGLCTFLLAELRGRESPRKLIYFIGLDDRTFNANVVEGMREELSDGLPHILKVIAQPSRSAAFLEWQELQLGQPDVRRAAAVIVAPCANDDRLWEAILRLMKHGVFVIALDLEPPIEFFAARGAAPPAFVASDFRVGGTAVGRIIAERMTQDDGLSALICIGPDSNVSSASRSSWLLYSLGRADVLGRCSTYQLPSWDLDEIVPAIVDLLRDRLRHDGRLIVYCGDDRTMRDVDKHFRAGFSELKGRLMLAGYDGILAGTGEFVAEDCAYAIATINTSPRAQGAAAGQILRDVYEGRAAAAPTKRIVVPEVVELLASQRSSTFTSEPA